MSIESPSVVGARTIAFLFTDIEGSTRLWERFPEGMRLSLARHDLILRQAVEGAAGQVVKTTGDGVMAVFGTARDGLAACLAAQLALRDEPWEETGPLRVRMGLHVGEGSWDGGDYHGPAVNRAARIMAAGHGGQVLLSGPTAALVMDQLPEGAVVRDLGEHRLKDLARPERVYQLVHPGLPADFKPLSTVDERLRSLPAEPSAFVGRELERAAIGERLTDAGVRLLTLTGPGGIGKTRLALRVAADVEDRFAAGAVFVDLSAARDASSLLTTIGRELGVADASEEAQLDALISHIGQQQLLAVLDNFEQLAATAPTLARILRDCPELKILVTSREALHVRGEHIFPVPSMGLPVPGPGSLTAAGIEQVEAVRLFVERARAIRPDFQVTDDNAVTLVDVCLRLEGLPLAIELATARLRVFSLEALRDRLDSRLGLLGSGARDLPERQQTLRATIDWSYQLLTPAEQRLFAVMSCFHGADIEAVEGVVGRLGQWLPGIEPIEGIISLADKSLLRQVEVDRQEPRFEMLESVREYAIERLEAEQGSAADVRTAHAMHYASWAVRNGDGRSEESTRLSVLAVELENLRSAWRCSVDDGDLDRLQDLMRGLWPLYDARGWYRGLTDLAEDALAVLATLPPSPEHSILAVTLRSNQARALTAMLGYTAEVEVAHERLLESLQGADVPQVYPVLRALASLYMFRSEHVKATEIGRQILHLGESQDDAMMRADGHLFVGVALAFRGRLEDGLPDLESGIRPFEEGPPVSRPQGLRNDPRVAILTALSLLHRWQGRLDRSAQRSEQAVTLALELGHASTTGYALFHAGLLGLWRGQPESSRDFAVRAIEVADEHDLPIWRAVGTVLLGASATALGLGDEGMRWMAEGLERYRGLRTPPVFWPFLLQLRAGACARVGRTEEGLKVIREALELQPVNADHQLLEGDLLLAAGSEGEAEAAYGRALEFAQRWGALTPSLGAAVRLCRMSPSDPSIRDLRLRILRETLESFSEGLETPDLVEARELLAADAASPGRGQSE